MSEGQTCDVLVSVDSSILPQTQNMCMHLATLVLPLSGCTNPAGCYKVCMSEGPNTPYRRAVSPTLPHDIAAGVSTAAAAQAAQQSVDALRQL